MELSFQTYLILRFKSLHVLQVYFMLSSSEQSKPMEFLQDHEAWKCSHFTSLDVLAFE